jgi:hypothetical protein
MTKLRVIHESYTYKTREPNSDDDWDRGDTHTDHTVNGLVIGEDSNCLSLADVAVGDKIWLVYAIYSTGDSFGHDSNEQIEFFTVHRNEEVARYNARVLEGFDSNADYNRRNKFFLSLDDGTQFQTVPPWCGYFESLSAVYCECFVVQDEGHQSLKKWRR